MTLLLLLKIVTEDEDIEEENYEEEDADASVEPEGQRSGTSYGWSKESKDHSHVQQRKMLDQSGLGASSKGHLDVLHLGIQGWIQETWQRLELDER